MGIVTRPIKPIGGAGTNEWVADTDIMANEENEDIVPIYTELNGKLNAANMDPNAALPGTMLAAAPNGVPNDRINNSAVTRNKILDGEVIESKLAVDSVSLTKLKETTHTNVGAIGPVAVDGAVDYDTGLATATTLPLLLYLTTARPLNFVFFQNAGTWRVRVNNNSIAPQTILANELKVVYLSN